MPNVAIYDMAGKEKGTIELSAEVFGAEVNEAVLHSVVRAYLLNQRQGTQSTLTRAEVSGGGIKPWRQKGTGRARAGSTRAPQFTHGGIVFAPKPRDYSYSLNKKEKRAALKSALSDKAANGNIIVVDGLAMEEIKTSLFAKFLNKVGAAKKAMVITNGVDEKVYKSARNIEGVSVTTAEILSTYEIMNANVLVVDKAAIEKIQEVFA